MAVVSYIAVVGDRARRTATGRSIMLRSLLFHGWKWVCEDVSLGWAV